LKKEDEMTLKINHDQQYKKFYIDIAGRSATLKYERFDGIIDLRVLFVPQNLRGKGIAKKVIEHVVKFAKKNNLKIKTSCSYIANYLIEHPELNEMVLKRQELQNIVLSDN
jgi:predicted GNAT family acetyltransferase